MPSLNGDARDTKAIQPSGYTRPDQKINLHPRDGSSVWYRFAAIVRREKSINKTSPPLAALSIPEAVSKSKSRPSDASPTKPSGCLRSSIQRPAATEILCPRVFPLSCIAIHLLIILILVNRQVGNYALLLEICIIIRQIGELDNLQCVNRLVYRLTRYCTIYKRTY